MDKYKAKEFPKLHKCEIQSHLRLTSTKREFFLIPVERVLMFVYYVTFANVLVTCRCQAVRGNVTFFSFFFARVLCPDSVRNLSV